MYFVRLIFVISLSVVMSGCVSYQVVGRFSDYNEVFHGTVNANLMTGGGSFRLEGKVNDVLCSGTAAPPHLIPNLMTCNGQVGNLFAECSDGRKVKGTWTAVACNKGYGEAVDNNGNKMFFTFGLSEKEAKEKIDEELNLASNYPDLPAYNPKQHRKEKGFSTGTGFFVSEDGYLVSNFHVIDDANEIKVRTVDGNEFDANVVAKDSANDVALLKVQGHFKPLPVASGSTVKKASEVMTLGYPLVQIQGQSQKATFGRINSMSGIQDDFRYFQIDIPIQPGNSGGPLISKGGKVIGVVTATLNQLKVLNVSGNLPQNVNYAVKADYLMPLLVANGVNPAGEGMQGFENIAEQYEKSVCFIVTR